MYCVYIKVLKIEIMNECQSIDCYCGLLQEDDDITQYWLVDTSQTLAVDQDLLYVRLKSLHAAE